MAKTSERAKGFCEDLAARVAPLRDAEMGRLLARKAAEDAETGKRKRDEITVIEPWDVAYFLDLLKREELAFDDEKVKEFFPLETTIDGLLETYSTMLGLSFERSAELPRWHEEVSAFVVKRGADVVGHPLPGPVSARGQVWPSDGGAARAVLRRLGRRRALRPRRLQHL